MSTALLGMAMNACSPDEFDGGNEADLPSASAYSNAFSIDVDQSTNYATFSFDQSLGQGVYPVWIIDGSYSTSTSFSKYYRKAGDYSVKMLIGNKNGTSRDTLTSSFHVDKTKMTGFGGFDYDSEYNMWKNATPELASCYYAPGWSQIDDPTVSISLDEINITLPEATTDQWQAQVAINTGLSFDATKSYDCSFIITSTKDHGNITFKLDDTDAIFYKAGISATANEPVCVWFSDLTVETGNDISNGKIVFDFGGNEAGTVITIESMVIKEHDNDDGTVLPEVDTRVEPEWVALESDDNLWYSATLSDPTYYYAPGWSQIDDPTLTTGTNSWTLTFPSATYERWQNQFAIPTDIAWDDAEQSIDFKVVIESSASFTGHCKLTDANSDDNYFFAEDVSLEEGGETTFWVTDVTIAVGAADQLKLVFDFGGNPDNTTVTIKNIILQKHN